MLQTPPLSLYVHLPWCVHKCPYCDFNSYGLKSPLRETEYVSALLRDLDQDLPQVDGRQVESVFFGGGTPSLFSPDAIGAIIRGARSRLPVAADAEISLEANPGTVEHGRFAKYRDVGVTRLSIGAQSFNNAHLKRLGRIHAADDVRRAAGEAHAAGIENFNLDLMYGLPDQTQAEAEADVAEALELAPAHISHYQLTIEPNTVFYAQPPTLPDDDRIWAMQQACQERLRDAGYAQYEVSGYARSGRQCRHNLNYWRYGDYLGIGAGAHAKITDARQNRIQRCWKTKHPTGYLRTAGTPDGIADRHWVGDADRAFEFMLNRLRLVEGFTADQFSSGTGLPIDTVLPVIQTCVKDGLLRVTDGHWNTTSRGFAFLNEVQARFLPESSGTAVGPGKPAAPVPSAHSLSHGS